MPNRVAKPPGFCAFPQIALIPTSPSALDLGVTKASVMQRRDHITFEIGDEADDQVCLAVWRDRKRTECGGDDAGFCSSEFGFAVCPADRDGFTHVRNGEAAVGVLGLMMHLAQKPTFERKMRTRTADPIGVASNRTGQSRVWNGQIGLAQFGQGLANTGVPVILAERVAVDICWHDRLGEI